MSEKIFNIDNITRIRYVEHEPNMFVTYYPPKKVLGLFDRKERWYHHPYRLYYTREELLEEYPDYMIDENNVLVRTEPILYISFTDKETIYFQKNAKQILDNIKKMNPHLLIFEY